MKKSQKMCLTVTVLVMYLTGCVTLNYLKGGEEVGTVTGSFFHERTFTNVLYILNPVEYRYELLIEEPSPHYARLVTIEFLPAENFVRTVVPDVGVNEKNRVSLKWTENSNGNVLVTSITLHVKTDSDVHIGSFPLIAGGK